MDKPNGGKTNFETLLCFETRFMNPSTIISGSPNTKPTGRTQKAT